jgi:hypothetical protein
MFLFTRTTRLRGDGQAGVAWALSITEKVKQVTGHDVQLWSTVYSPGFGTISWTAWFEDLAALEVVGDKLDADPGMAALGNQGNDLTDGTLDDGLLEPIYGDPAAGGDAQYVGGAVAVCATGNIERALGLGVKIAQRAEAVTGLPTMFVRSMTGPYGGVGWLTGYPTITELEKAEAAIATDDGFVKLIDSTKGCFVEGAATTRATLYRRLG